ncbi:MAG: OsmC family protein [Bacteroidota bacterium]|jgi:organic hydroperoxide reductase OsmC/OhrA
MNQTIDGQVQTPQPLKKFKTFMYHSSLVWHEARQGMLSSTGKPPIEVSSPPEFKGIPGLWTPEDLFVASVEICTMSTFLSFGGRKNIPLVSYRSTAKGVLESVEGKYRFTRITIIPEIIVRNEWTEQQVKDVVHEAHENCLIANSISAEVEIVPNIIRKEPELQR